MDEQLLAERRGRLGLLTLNRPAALNALNQHMVDRSADALAAWRDDGGIAAVAIVGAGDRALCAGGDIVALYHDATGGDGTASARFWRDEYRLDAAIARYPKPIVAIQDGVVLGGGIGISAHASHRIATERSRIGLPETGIGFVPDVGASWLLSRSPGGAGLRLALSAASVGAADAVHAGLSDVVMPSAAIPALLHDLEREDVEAVVARYAEPAGDSALAADADWVDPAFAMESVPAILDALEATGIPAAASLARVIRAKSPIATAVALASVRRARDLPSLEHALDVEFRVSMHALTTHDFAEGVRAQVIDKDRNPQWAPADRTEIADADVDAYFAPVDGDELGLAPGTERTTA